MRSCIAKALCIILAYAFLSGDALAGTIYKYLGKDGSVVFGDSPPSGTKAKPVQKFQDLTDAEKKDIEKEKILQMEQYRETDVKRQEKEEKFRTAKEEYEQAIRNEERIRSNKNQAHGFAQQNYWRKQLEEQNKEIEEKKKRLQEIEMEP